MAKDIPIVDFSCLSLGVTDEELNADDVELTSGQIVDAFTSIGFVYLKNTGVSSDLVSALKGRGRKMMDLWMGWLIVYMIKDFMYECTGKYVCNYLRRHFCRAF